VNNLAAVHVYSSLVNNSANGITNLGAPIDWRHCVVAWRRTVERRLKVASIGDID
jgi:hypothetical protein